jgi:hypothetical protein
MKMTDKIMTDDIEINRSEILILKQQIVVLVKAVRRLKYQIRAAAKALTTLPTSGEIESMKNAEEAALALAEDFLLDDI